MTLTTSHLAKGGTRRVVGLALRLFLVLIAAGAVIALTAGCSSRGATTARQPSQANTGAGKRESADPAKASPAPRAARANEEPGQAARSSTIDVDKATGPLIQIDQDNIAFRWIEKDGLRMRASAREGQVDVPAQTGVLYNVSVEMYEKGKLSSVIKAPKMVADGATRVLTAVGGVTMKSVERATTVNAQWVKWYSKQQKVIGGGGVKIRSKTEPNVWDMNSAAFVADTGLKTITLKNSTKGLLPK